MNNRDFTRINLDEWGTITYKNETFGGQVENISLRGLFIQTSKQLPMHEPIEVSVHHAIDKSMDFEATVVRIDESGLGLMIDKMDVDSLLYIKNLLVEHSGDHDLALEETRKKVQQLL